MKQLLSLLAAVAFLVPSLAVAQDLIKNPGFEFDGDLPIGWRIGFYIGGTSSPDWKQTELLKVSWRDEAMVVEMERGESAAIFFQSASAFQGGSRYKVTLTYDDAGLDGKLVVMFDGGPDGVSGAPMLEFPPADKSGEMVTNSLEIEVPADATAEMMAKSNFHLRVLGQGMARIRMLEVERL